MRFQPQIDFDRMALIGADAGRVGVEGKALLVVLSDNFLQHGARQGDAMLIGFQHQLVNVGPALRIKRQADLARPVSQHPAQEFADLH